MSKQETFKQLMERRAAQKAKRDATTKQQLGTKLASGYRPAGSVRL